MSHVQLGGTNRVPWQSCMCDTASCATF